MRSLARRLTFVFSAMFCMVETSAAQSASPSSSPGAAQSGAPAASPLPLPANDSIFRRARRMVSDGNGAAGRALVDSMLRAASEGTRSYGDALYWRGALAETAADAERDYRKVVVEYPLSPYVADALLSLAELEQARGDRAAAFQHLQRFVREHPIGPLRARAGLAAARLAFEQRDVTRGCAMIADARTSAGTGDVELRNQIDYYATRCPTAPATVPGASAVASATPATTAPATTPASAPPSGTSAASGASVPTSTPSTAPRNASNADAPRTASSTTATADALPTTTTTKPTTPAPTSAAPKAGTPAPTPPRTAAKSAPTAVETTPPKAATASTPRGTWTIQLAAYNTRLDAEQLVKKLSGRGVKARISGESKPFRVRLDFYPTRQAAAAAVAELRERGIIGFVTEEARPSGATSP